MMLRFLELRLPILYVFLLVSDHQGRRAGFRAELVLDGDRVGAGVSFLDLVHL